jgi:hypothetical protein
LKVSDPSFAQGKPSEKVGRKAKGAKTDTHPRRSCQPDCQREEALELHREDRNTKGDPISPTRQETGGFFFAFFPSTDRQTGLTE